MSLSAFSSSISVLFWFSKTATRFSKHFTYSFFFRLHSRAASLHTHTQAHTYTHTHTHTHRHTQVLMVQSSTDMSHLQHLNNTHTCRHTQTYSHTRMSTQTHTHTHTSLLKGSVITTTVITVMSLPMALLLRGLEAVGHTW